MKAKTKEKYRTDFDGETMKYLNVLSMKNNKEKTLDNFETPQLNNDSRITKS